MQKTLREDVQQGGRKVRVYIDLEDELKDTRIGSIRGEMW